MSKVEQILSRLRLEFRNWDAKDEPLLSRMHGDSGTVAEDMGVNVVKPLLAEVCRLRNQLDSSLTVREEVRAENKRLRQQFPWGIDKDMTYIPTSEYRKLSARLKRLKALAREALADG